MRFDAALGAYSFWLRRGDLSATCRGAETARRGGCALRPPPLGHGAYVHTMNSTAARALSEVRARLGGDVICQSKARHVSRTVTPHDASMRRM